MAKKQSRTATPSIPTPAGDPSATPTDETSGTPSPAVETPPTGLADGDPAAGDAVDQANDAGEGDVSPADGESEPDGANDSTDADEPIDPLQADVDDARQAYDALLEAAQAFDRENIQIERQWKKEIGDRRTARKAERNALLARKLEASRTLKAAEDALAAAGKDAAAE